MTQLDPDNLEPFQYAMTREIDPGDEGSALEYLVQGRLRTAQTSDYYLEKLTLVRNKLMEIGYPADEAEELPPKASFQPSLVLLKEKIQNQTNSSSKDSTHAKVSTNFTFSMFTAINPC